ncbi:hypothetical protein [Kitasatospora sp. NPDC057936]|uniref:hypothetical protein n=1 Tax=Kitasatospora sp. NPDC057936 TaxID=3346283 RepID=UPI0036D77679
MGISGFSPTFLVGIDAVRQRHAARLAGLVGRRLTGFAVVRFAEDGDWFADCPVVLDFDGARVEVCHSKLHDLSIGWDTIDTSAAVSGWEQSEFTPEWSHRDDRLEPFVGRELRGVALVERRPPSGRCYLDVGTVGVEFDFGDGHEARRLRIVNGLDENGIELGEPEPGSVRHELGD